MFSLAGERGSHFNDAMTFLSLRQLKSADSNIDGGWATNTSAGNPVVDSTAWIARYLAVSGAFWEPNAPDAGKAYRWLLKNQNDDGGWGAARNCPSRVWLTCLGIQALVALNRHEPAIPRGIDWLFTQQDDTSCAWGESVDAPASGAHTALALRTIMEARPSLTDSRILKAYEWLEDLVGSHRAPDRYVETYEVTVESGIAGGRTRWQNSMHHYVVPLAASAFLRHPVGARSDLIGSLYNQILLEQLEAGHWPSIHGGPSISIWSVWSFYEALHDIDSVPLVRLGDGITWLPGAIVLQRAAVKRRSVRSLVGEHYTVRAGRLARRHWAGLVLAVVTAAGITSVVLQKLDWSGFLIGLAFPLLLFLVQEGRGRRTAERS